MSGRISEEDSTNLTDYEYPGFHNIKRRHGGEEELLRRASM